MDNTYKGKIGFTGNKSRFYFIVLEDWSGAFRKRKLIGKILSYNGQIYTVEYDLNFVVWN